MIRPIILNYFFPVLWLVEIGLTIATMIWIKENYASCEIPSNQRQVMPGTYADIF